MNKYKSTNWSIILDEGWESELNEECHTFFHPHGVGALQISAYTKGTTITDQDLLKNTGLDEEGISHLGKNDWGQFHGYQLIYGAGDTFWRKWWLRNDKVFLFVTYNCDIHENEIEANIVNNIMSTLSVEY